MITAAELRALMLTSDTFLQAIAADPGDVAHLLIAADWCDEQGLLKDAATLRSGRMPTTAMEIWAAVSLVSCRFLPGGFDKRFASDLAERFTMQGYSGTPKQWACFWRMVWKYRGQILNQGNLPVIERARCLLQKLPAASSPPSPSNQPTLPFG